MSSFFLIYFYSHLNKITSGVCTDEDCSALYELSFKSIFLAIILVRRVNTTTHLCFALYELSFIFIFLASTWIFYANNRCRWSLTFYCNLLFNYLCQMKNMWCFGDISFDRFSCEVTLKCKEESRDKHLGNCCHGFLDVSSLGKLCDLIEEKVVKMFESCFNY